MQQTLWPDPAPDLSWYDLLLVNVSGGKDSQATLDVVHERAAEAAIQDRIVLVHADLGEAEWPQTLGLVREHAAHYRARLEVVRREIIDPDTGERRPQELLEQVLARGMWPDRRRRWCTSDWKRGPCLTVMTQLVREVKPEHLGRPVRVLNIFGFRAQESPERRQRQPLQHDQRASNGRRHVDVWLPIHRWGVQQVWARCAQAGTRVHPAYTEHGMPRLSCQLCPLASAGALVLAARADPEKARRYLTVEEQTGHSFQAHTSIAEIIARAKSPASVPSPAAWTG
jgi:3'-phosphoadenosine 5'-phosphosulfate sulfotransferase (PAPS reductase)/FAD synthetase